MNDLFQQKLKEDALAFDLHLDPQFQKQMMAAIEREGEHLTRVSEIEAYQASQKNLRYPIFSSWFTWGSSFIAATLVISLMNTHFPKTNDEGTDLTAFNQLPTTDSGVEVEKIFQANTLGRLERESQALEKDIKSIISQFALKPKSVDHKA
ncbi:MAG: hypothetical protein COW84_03660 [Gammaproteobacteria bacterium CG22_combo_CG10-13_8_21_14_all_40_8]|nr:MAG: hypothetical protein COW84_03660 [Gammaproteobacteria bacterium CG22_combo_CG10-13_8_21_14_all_40_8]